MRKRFVGSILALAAMVFLSSVAVAQTAPLPGGAAPKAAAVFDAHDLSGHWSRTSPSQTFSNIDPGGPRSDVPEAPSLTADGKARFDRNRPGFGPRAATNLNDPMGSCDPLGVPRLLIAEVGAPHQTMQVVQLSGRMLQFFEWHHDWREIWTDGRQLPRPEDLEPKWNGYSVGKWEGNTFVVNSTAFDERTWLDRLGYPHSEQMQLEERYRRLDADTLELVMTITDSEIYTKPWTSDTKIFKLNRAKAMLADPQVYCVPTEENEFNRLIRDGGAGRRQP